jgi:hypothetical protein
MPLMTIYDVPWIPRYVTEADARCVLAASVRRTPDRSWRWVWARPTHRD